MTVPFEIELKLECQPADRDAIVGADALAGATPVTRRLVSTYFDTPDRVLERNGFSLRVRRIGDSVVQTVKADGGPTAGLFARPEWECPLTDETPRIDAGSPIAALLAGRTVVPLFVSDISRSIWTLATADATIEVALDLGEVRAGAHRHPVSDLELELKAGQAGALFALAHRLDAVAPLRLGVLTKSERGRLLLADPARPAARAASPRLDPEDDAAGAFAAIARACLHQFRLNETLVIAAGDAAAIHQARVGLRRLRAAFALFRPILAGDVTAARLRADLRWLTGVLADVRALDVLIAAPGHAGHGRLLAARADALARARATLAEPRARRLMLDLAEWLAVGDWRTASARAAMPIARLAADLLDHSRRRLKRRGRDLAALDDARRHRARIAAKTLRYASAFFATLWTGRKAERRHAEFIAALETLQDRLGALNDMAAAPMLHARLGLAPPPALSRRERAHLLDRAAAAHERLMDMKRFWR